MSGIHNLSRSRARPFLRLAVFGVLALSLGLAACGRKGPLDPPPGAAATSAPQDQAGIRSPIGVTPIGGQASSGNAGIGPDGRAQAPRGPKRSIPLDVLLN